MQIHPLLSAKMSRDTRDVLPVIIYSNHTIYEIRDTITDNFGQIRYELPFINAVAVELSREKINTVSKSSKVRMITDDAIVSKLNDTTYDFCLPEDAPPFPASYAETLASDRLQPANRHPALKLMRGHGVGVAVIDTGVSPHYDLIYPQNRIAAFHDFINQRKEPYDDDGHGTHVAGIIAGNGFTSSKYIGSAPCSHIVALKALDQDGNGTTSDILAAMQWCINNQRLFNIRVVNLSLGISSTADYEDDPLIKGANSVIRHGISVVAAAGNSGPGRSTINSPGSSPHVLTVGAADMSQVRDGGSVCVAEFSSRGPTSLGLVKPDLLAPGVDIISLSNVDSKGYAVQTGTSMATPVVSGAAACLYAQRPRLTPHQVKLLLADSTLPVKEEHPNAQGRGVLDYEIFLEL